MNGYAFVTNLSDRERIVPWDGVDYVLPASAQQALFPEDVARQFAVRCNQDATQLGVTVEAYHGSVALVPKGHFQDPVTGQRFDTLDELLAHARAQGAAAAASIASPGAGNAPANTDAAGDPGKDGDDTDTAAGNARARLLSLSRSALESLAKQYGLTGLSDLNKEELADAILKAQAAG